MKRIKDLMLTAMFLSILFLLSYICHHLLAGDTNLGCQSRRNGYEAEKTDAGLCDYLLCASLDTYSSRRHYSSFYFIYGLPGTHWGIPGA